jgi:hypothetical protein
MRSEASPVSYEKETKADASLTLRTTGWDAFLSA